MKTVYTTEQKAQVVTLYQNGNKYSEINRLTGVPTGTISAIVSRAGVQLTNRPRRPKRNSYTKEQWQHAVDLFNQGKTSKFIARTTGIKYGTIKVQLPKMGYSFNRTPATVTTRDFKKESNALFSLIAEGVIEILTPKIEAKVKEAVRSILKGV